MCLGLLAIRTSYLFYLCIKIGTILEDCSHGYFSSIYLFIFVIWGLYYSFIYFLLKFSNTIATKFFYFLCSKKAQVLAAIAMQHCRKAFMISVHLSVGRLSVCTLTHENMFVFSLNFVINAHCRTFLVNNEENWMR